MNRAQASGDIIKDPTAFAALTKIHKKPVLDCCFSPENDQILTASEDKTVVLWNLPPSEIELHDETIHEEHKLVCYRLPDHQSEVTSVAMHKRLFLSATKNGYVKLWRLVTVPSTSSSSNIGRHDFRQPSPEATTYKCCPLSIESICFSPDARQFATASHEKYVKIWSSECINKRLATFGDGHNNWVKCVRYSKTSGSKLASCGDDGKICIWDARTLVRQSPMLEIHVRGRGYNCLEWHPVFEHHIATGASDGSCIVWDLRNRKPVQVYMEHYQAVKSIAFNSGGSLLLSGSQDCTSRIYDVCEGRNMFTLKSHNMPITSVCFNATDDLFATSSLDSTVTVWRRNFETVNIVAGDARSEHDEAYLDLASEHGSSAPIASRQQEHECQQDYHYDRVYTR